MDEFSLIDTFFTPINIRRSDVKFGIGDDAACVKVPNKSDLLISCDTLIAGVHFLESWDPYDIAYRGVMSNISDIAAMAGKPAWILLALTIPSLNVSWLSQFALGLKNALQEYNVALIGGDTTHGALSMTYTIHGFVEKGKAVKRNGAKIDDKIYVTGTLGAAALAIDIEALNHLKKEEQSTVLNKLYKPEPRIDFANCLRKFATAAIDISDGLAADLNHICQKSGVGAAIDLSKIPIHPIVIHSKKALDFALFGGDDYELCFTVSAAQENNFLSYVKRHNLHCTAIGFIESEPGLRSLDDTGNFQSLTPKGYRHF